MISIMCTSGAIIVLLYILIVRGKKPLNEGYEKLVLPILTRLSSSGSCGKDEDSQEWVWLSKAQIDGNSISKFVSNKLFFIFFSFLLPSFFFLIPY